MTVEALLLIIGLCLLCIYFIFEYQRAAIPPYQEPLKCTGDCGQGRYCTCTQPSVLKEAVDELEPTPLNPQAAWPFPSGSKP